MTVVVLGPGVEGKEGSAKVKEPRGSKGAKTKAPEPEALEELPLVEQGIVAARDEAERELRRVARDLHATTGGLVDAALAYREAWHAWADIAVEKGTIGGAKSGT